MYFPQVCRNFIIYIKNHLNSIISLNDIAHYETRYLSLVLHGEETAKLLREFSTPTYGKIRSTKYFNIHFKGCS